jgi:hypothetical protein
MTLVSAPRHLAIAAPVIAAIAAAAGCVTEKVDPRSGGGDSDERLLEFPDAKHLVESSTVLYEVNLCFEMDRQPQKDPKGMAIEEPAVARLKKPGQAGESYVAGYLSADDQEILTDPSVTVDDPRVLGVSRRLQKEGHTFSYAGGSFIIGGIRYPAERGALCFIFQKRDGAFTFLFRGRKVTIERDGTWKPAVLYRELQDVRDVSPKGGTGGARRTGKRRIVSRVLEEAVQAGAHRIVVTPGREAWRVNQVQVRVPPGGSIVIDREGNVTAS